MCVSVCVCVSVSVCVCLSVCLSVSRDIAALKGGLGKLPKEVTQDGDLNVRGRQEQEGKRVPAGSRACAKAPRQDRAWQS